MRTRQLPGGAIYYVLTPGLQDIIAELDGLFLPDARRDEPVIHVLTELADRYPGYGFKKLFQLLVQQAIPGAINALTGFNAIRRKGKQRLPVRNRVPLPTPQALKLSRRSILCTLRWSVADASGP